VSTAQGGISCEFAILLNMPPHGDPSEHFALLLPTQQNKQKSNLEQTSNIGISGPAVNFDSYLQSPS